MNFSSTGLLVFNIFICWNLFGFSQALAQGSIENRNLNGTELYQLLYGRSLFGSASGQSFIQYFSPTGQTVLVMSDQVDSGYWSIFNDKLCTNWKTGEKACYIAVVAQGFKIEWRGPVRSGVSAATWSQYRTVSVTGLERGNQTGVVIPGEGRFVNPPIQAMQNSVIGRIISFWLQIK